MTQRKPLAQTRLAAVIACYRDEPAVPIMHERLTKVFTELGVDYEIIFVNDGSPDNARQVLTELAARDPHTVVVNHTRNFGSQSAFTSGMRISTADAVVLLDGDLQDPPELIPEFVKKWHEGYDVVYGERVQREAPRMMQLAYKSFYRIFERFAYVKVPLDAGDFGLLDRRVMDTINRLPETHRFMRGLRAWAGYKSIGVPYVRPERMFGTTTNNFRRNMGWARRAIVSFSYAPLDMITVLALLTTAAAFLGTVLTVIMRFASPETAPRGIATIIVLVLFIGGIQLLCLSIIGSYLAHIYEEVKARPPYVVDEILNLPDPAALSNSTPTEEELAGASATAAAGTAERRTLGEPDPH